MMKRFLLSLGLFCIGCGNPPTNVGNVIVPSTEGLRGELDTQVVIVSYVDSPNLQSPVSLAPSLNLLNDFIVRNSTGAAYLTFDYRQETLSGGVEDYLNAQYIPPEPHANTRLQQECLALVRKRFNFFVLPPHPAFYSGGIVSGKRAAWLSTVTAPEYMPFAHEFGHMLGFPHTSLGIMSGDDAAAQQNWSGWYDDNALSSVGWLTRGLATPERRL